MAMWWTLETCCAKPTSGQAVAIPISEMNSRRLMDQLHGGEASEVRNSWDPVAHAAALQELFAWKLSLGSWLCPGSSTGMVVAASARQKYVAYRTESLRRRYGVFVLAQRH